MQPRRGRTGHLGERRVHDIRCPAQLGGAIGARLQRHVVDLVRLEAPQDGRGTLGAADGAHDDEVPQSLEEVFDESTRILPGLDDAVDGSERGGRVARTEGVDDLAQQGTVGVAEQRDGPLVLHGGALGTGDELVEQGQRVPHAAAASPHHEREHARLGGDPLALAELVHVLEHLRRRDQAEGVVMSPGADGADHLVGLGRREDELHVLRRLLDDLEQGVESLRRDHVRLIEDEDLEAVPGGCEDRPLPQVPGVVDAVVARRVDLDDVEGAAAVATQFDTARAHPARGVGRTLGAIEAPGEDTSGRRLATASRAAEQVRVVHAVVAQRGAQRVGHLSLTDELGERFRPIAAIEGCNHEDEPIRYHRPSSRRDEVPPAPVGIPNHGPEDKDEDPSRTRQSPVTLATFPSWGSWPG